MKNYFRHIKTKPTHERRQHAVKIAGAFTAVVFVFWITTLGVRLGRSPEGDASQLAGAAAAGMTSNTLEVATTTSYYAQ